jgi:ferritin
MRRVLDKHAGEEMGHMRRIWKYVLESGFMPCSVLSRRRPATSRTSRRVRGGLYPRAAGDAKINELAQAAFEEKDMITFNFMQWFVAEQHEEEALARAILDRIKVIGLEGKGLFFIDQEAAKFGNQGAPSGVEASST